MNSTIFIQMSAIIYSVLIIIIYFSKKRFRSFENRIYSNLIIINFLGLVIDITLGLVSANYDKYSLQTIVLTKFYLIYFITWMSYFTYYIIYISRTTNKRSYDKSNIVLLLFVIIVSMIIYLLPVTIDKTTNGMHSSGIGTILAYLISAVEIIVCTICLIKNLRTKKLKKYIPLFIFMVLGTVVALVQMFNPTIILIPAMETFVTFIMYFTIENPDMKLLDEMHKAKEISDNANEEKTMFLYNMTQEIRETTKNINSEADIILDSDSLEQDKDSARNIKGETSKFMNVTNDILDVSTIDSTSIKVYNNKYNIKNILKEVIGIYTPKVKKKELEFRTNIEHNIPELLYGDSIELKKVLSLILDNSVKYTEKGYVELDVNTIIKNDICRLIITIEDSGVGIKSSSLEQIKLNDLNTSQAYKTITLMNGTMLISSNYGVGTKVKIILDQKIQLEESADLKKYQEIYDNKKILVIDDNEATYKIVEKLLKGSNIIVDYSLTGKDTLTKLKSKKKYDLILLDEELSQITGYELLKKMREIRNFNVPVILLSKDNNYEYNEEYKQVGFTDVLIKPLKKDNLHLEIEKYFK